MDPIERNCDARLTLLRVSGCTVPSPQTCFVQYLEPSAKTAGENQLIVIQGQERNEAKLKGEEINGEKIQKKKRKRKAVNYRSLFCFYLC